MNNFKACEVMLLSSSDDEEHHSSFLSNSVPMESLKAENNVKALLSAHKEEECATRKRVRAAVHSVSESDDDTDSDASLPSLDLGDRLMHNKLSSLNDQIPTLQDDLKMPQTVFDEISLSSKDEIHPFNKVPKKAKSSRGNSEKSLEKLKERETKKEEKELAKALKAIEREVKKSDKPQERLKCMRVAFDSRLKEIPGSDDLISSLQALEFSHTFEENHLPFSVQWYHKMTDIDIVNNKVNKVEREDLENYLLLYLPQSFFVDLVNASVQARKKDNSCEQTLLGYLLNVKDAFPQMNISCVVIGIEDFFREKAEARRKKKDSQQLVNNARAAHSTKNVSRKDIEEAMIEVQMQAVVNFKLLDNISQFAELLAMYTKAIAEAPLKREKHQQQGFSWYADADSSCPVKISKDGTGLINLWQQQICQFQNVGKEVAQAIAAQYPSPVMLMKAYRKCVSKCEAEKLLQDIVVRRGFGPLGTTRRIGPELSYKIYLFFTSSDGNLLVQR